MASNPPTPASSDLPAVDLRSVAVDGLVAGVLASIVVGLAFLVYDAMVSTPLHTPSVLGTRIFRGIEAAQGVQVDVPMAIAYNGLHFLGFVVGGLLCAYVAAWVEHAPRTWYLALVGLSFVLAAILYADAAVDIAGLGRFRLFGASLLGVLTMGVYLWWMHPGIKRHLEDVWRD